MTRTAVLAAWSILTMLFVVAMLFVVFGPRPYMAVPFALIAGPASLITLVALLTVDSREARKPCY